MDYGLDQELRPAAGTAADAEGFSIARKRRSRAKGFQANSMMLLTNCAAGETAKRRCCYSMVTGFLQGRNGGVENPTRSATWGGRAMTMSALCYMETTAADLQSMALHARVANMQSR
jgi:hypothetical protein